jgi:hypothetical protein
MLMTLEHPLTSIMAGAEQKFFRDLGARIEACSARPVGKCR